LPTDHSLLMERTFAAPRDHNWWARKQMKTALGDKKNAPRVTAKEVQEHFNKLSQERAAEWKKDLDEEKAQLEVSNEPAVTA
jgi:hypothetical protein